MTREELAEAVASHEIEIDIRGMSMDDAIELSEFFEQFGYKPKYSWTNLAEQLMDFSHRYGILVAVKLGYGDDIKTFGANTPDRYGFCERRIPLDEALSIIRSDLEPNISEEDFEFVL